MKSSKKGKVEKKTARGYNENKLYTIRWRIGWKVGRGLNARKREEERIARMFKGVRI